jgi:tetratricopeptide (TPR) repeat protein
VDTGRVLASLEAPDATRSYCLEFSPDGRFLAVARTDQRVDLWDLSTIRRRLTEVHLERGFPDQFDGSPPESHAQPINRIDVRGADAAGLRLLAVRHTLQAAWLAFRRLLDSKLDDAEELLVRGRSWDRMGHWQLAAADYRESLARRPGSDITANALAWCLATKSDHRDAGEALRWAREAVGMQPDNAAYRNTLGLALYRVGELAEAAAVLESNAPGDPDGAGFDWLFLAMCRERMGQPAKARTAREKALRWRAENVRMPVEQAAQFQAFLRETESVLNERVPDLPADVFAP